MGNWGTDTPNCRDPGCRTSGVPPSMALSALSYLCPQTMKDTQRGLRGVPKGVGGTVHRSVLVASGLLCVKNTTVPHFRGSWSRQF